MEQQSGREGAAAAPRLSPDGRWWWNGSEWQPASGSAPSPPSSRRRVRPGRWAYVAAALMIVAGGALGASGFASIGSGFSAIANATRVDAPGTSQITLPEAGTYTISYEQQTSGGAGGGVDGSSSPPDLPPEISSMQLELVSAASGRPVPIRVPSATYSYTLGETQGVVIAVFDVDGPGTYALTSRYATGASQPEIVLAIMRGSPGAVFARGALFVLGAFGGVVLAFFGLVVGAVVLFFRVRARDRERAAAAASRGPGR